MKIKKATASTQTKTSHSQISTTYLVAKKHEDITRSRHLNLNHVLKVWSCNGKEKSTKFISAFDRARAIAKKKALAEMGYIVGTENGTIYFDIDVASYVVEYANGNICYYQNLETAKDCI